MCELAKFGHVPSSRERWFFRKEIKGHTCSDIYRNDVARIPDREKGREGQLLCLPCPPGTGRNHILDLTGLLPLHFPFVLQSAWGLSPSFSNFMETTATHTHTQTVREIVSSEEQMLTWTSPSLMGVRSQGKKQPQDERKELTKAGRWGRPWLAGRYDRLLQDWLVSGTVWPELRFHRKAPWSPNAWQPSAHAFNERLLHLRSHQWCWRECYNDAASLFLWV